MNASRVPDSKESTTLINSLLLSDESKKSLQKNALENGIKPPELTIIPHANFVIVMLSSSLEELKKKKFSKIAAIDLDDTMSDNNFTQLMKEAVALDELENKKILENENDKDCLFVCVTARNNPLRDLNQLSDHPLSALNILKALSNNKFSMLIFSDGKSKVPALDYLFHFFELKNKKQLCLMDDAKHNITACLQAGYIAIPVFFGLEPTHGDVFQQFLTGTLKDDFHNKYIEAYFDEINKFSVILKPQPISPAAPGAGVKSDLVDVDLGITVSTLSLH